MATRTTLNVSLPAELGQFVEKLVHTGRYASASEVVRAGLRALRERDAAVERWLREEVVSVCAAMDADPSRAIPIDDAFAAVRAHQAERMTRKRRGA